MPHRDDIASQLSQLSIPEPSSNAVHRIMEASKQEKRRHFTLFDPLRKLRAQLYVPSIRYGVMASVFGAVILLGAANRLSQEPNSPAPQNNVQTAQAPQEKPRVPITADNLPNDVLLYDVELSDADPLDGMWES